MDQLNALWGQYLFSPEAGVVSAIVAVVSIVAMWVLFVKAQKAGWRSLIPLLNIYTLCQIADGHGWKFILFLIPGVNFVYHLIFNHRLARSFGKGAVYWLGLVFLPPLFTLFLGLGKAKYRGPRGRKT